MSSGWSDGYLAGTYVFLGVQSLQLWLRRRQERGHGWLFAMCAGALGVDVSGRVIEGHPAAAAGMVLWNGLNGVSAGLTIAAILGMVQAFGGRLPRRVAWALQAYALLGCAIGALISPAYLPVCVLPPLAVAMATALHAAWAGDRDSRTAVFGFAWLAIGLGVDAVCTALKIQLHGVPVLVGFTGLFLALSYVLSNRFDRTHRALEALRRDLEHRVAERTAAITRANGRLQRYLPASLVHRLIEAEEAPLAPTTERAIVTLLFADLQGFTSFSEKLDPQEVTRTLNLWLKAMADEIARTGGTLDKMMGDGLMAIWGAPDPMPPEQQAQAAVASALAMQARMATLFDGSAPFKLRIGLHQDRVAIGNLGTPERWSWTAIGRGVNLAARLESACVPGGLLASEAVVAHLPKRSGFGPSRPYVLKGFTEPVRAALLESGAASNPAPAEAGAHTDAGARADAGADAGATGTGTGTGTGR